MPGHPNPLLPDDDPGLDLLREGLRPRAITAAPERTAINPNDFPRMVELDALGVSADFAQPVVGVVDRLEAHRGHAA